MLGLILAAAAALAAVPPPTPCAYDRERMLALSPEKFDQDLQGGWRPLADKPACMKIAADLLAAYRKAHWGTLKQGELHLNYFHEGQVRASAGDEAGAAPLLMAGVDPDGDDIGFADYVIGTVAFIEHDRQGLELARRRLATRAPPAKWAAMVLSFERAYGEKPAWPPNLDVLDGLITCFDRPYAEAYGASCRPKTPSAEHPAVTRAESKP